MGAHAAKNIQAQLKEATNLSALNHKVLFVLSEIRALGIVGKTDIKRIPSFIHEKIIMNKALFETGGTKEMMAKGRFDLYH